MIPEMLAVRVILLVKFNLAFFAEMIVVGRTFDPRFTFITLASINFKRFVPVSGRSLFYFTRIYKYI